MGCASSKEKVCRNCQAPYSPVRRSYSMHVQDAPARKTGDSHQVVALTSSTLGSLKFDPMIQNPILEDKVQTIQNRSTESKAPMIQNHGFVEDTRVQNRGIDKEKAVKEEFAMGMIEAKTWSQMINEKIPKIIPKTPIRTPLGEPELINAWELMEGLEDISPLRPANHIRSFSFHVPRNPNLSSLDEKPTPCVKENGKEIAKPMWLEMADNDSSSNSNDASIVSECDPDVIAIFRKALEDLPPASPFQLEKLHNEMHAGKDQALDVMDEKKVNGIELRNKIMPEGSDKLIMYFTSLRGVRKTYEDCCHVRVILKGLGVKVDERDVSMDLGLKEELQELLGEGFNRGSLPRVFLGRTYIGGAEEIQRLNEEGKLEKMVERCAVVEDGGGGEGPGGVCDACGDIRFVPCETCSGSCKIYYEDDYTEDQEYEETENEYGFHRCQDCNENGLIRCPICCD